MSNKANTITVVLEKDFRIEDDLQPILDAIKMVRGVLSVSPQVADASEYMAISRARQALGEKIMEVIYPLS